MLTLQIAESVDDSSTHLLLKLCSYTKLKKCPENKRLNTEKTKLYLDSSI